MKLSWSLEGLARDTGIEPRTIRNYIERGLLRGAEGRGRAARYGEHHRDRLLGIRTLRERTSLTLDQIRRHLSSLGRGSLRALAAGQPPMEPSTGAAVGFLGEPVTSCGAPDGESLHAPVPPDAESIWSDPVVESGLTRLVRAAQRLDGTHRAPRKARAETWVSIPVTPDLELRARGLDAADVHGLELLADHLRHALLRDADDDETTRKVRDR